MYKIGFYVPESHLESVKVAMFAVGAGQVGKYQACAWQVKGQGQFKPEKGSDPYLGEVEKITYIEEYRVELVCQSEFLSAVIAAMKRAHPYEEVAYDVVLMIDIFDQ